MANPKPRTPSHVGPSDSTDSAPDLIGADDWRPEADPPGMGPRVLEAETDAEGTGERAAAGNDPPTEGADIAPDRVIGLDLPVVPDGLDREDALLSDEELDFLEDDQPSERRKGQSSAP